MSEDDLSQALHQLKSFDRPDMYAILKDKIIIIEHFEFDASVCSRKGMKGKKRSGCSTIAFLPHQSATNFM